MKQIAISTAFLGYDPAFGLCHAVRNDVKMLTRRGEQMPQRG